MPPMDTLGGDMGGIPNIADAPPNDMPPMDGNDPMMPNGEDGFDAGVEADPSEDPKKYLQQLSGKLSQELRKYNDEQEQPDEDLNKYVAGMIIPQATKGLTDKGKKEIIGKIKKGNVDEPIEEPSDADENISSNEEMPMEGKTWSKKQLTELFRRLGSQEETDEKKKADKITNKTLPKRNPFRSGR